MVQVCAVTSGISICVRYLIHYIATNINAGSYKSVDIDDFVHYGTLDGYHMLRVTHSGKQGYNAMSIGKWLSVKMTSYPRRYEY